MYIYIYIYIYTYVSYDVPPLSTTTPPPPKNKNLQRHWMCVRHVDPGEPGIQIATCILDGKNPHFAGSPVDFGGGSRLMLPSSKLTWQWKITIFNRGLHLQLVHFPLPC